MLFSKQLHTTPHPGGYAKPAVSIPDIGTTLRLLATHLHKAKGRKGKTQVANNKILERAYK